MRKSFISISVAAVLVVGALLGLTFLKKDSPTTTTTSTTTTVPAPLAPLTGLPDPSRQSQLRPAMTVKIENIMAAMPQRGIDQADVIYEEIVEGRITRLAAIFNTHAPPQIGPIRSVRKTDHSIVWPIGGIFVYSGGAPYAIQDIALAPVHTVNETQAGPAMFRDHNGRVPPDNLYGIGPRLFALGGSPVPPPPLFSYRTPSAAIPGVNVLSFVVGFGRGYTVSFDWNPHTQSWDRNQFQAPDVTYNGVRMSPKNVIVMYVNYIGGVGVLGAQANMVGQGSATVFVGGKEIIGTWRRPTVSVATKYFDSAGHEIKLTPGQTWVELLSIGDPLGVTPAPVATPGTTAH